MQKIIFFLGGGIKPPDNRCHKTNGHPKGINLQREIKTKHLLACERNHWANAHLNSLIFNLTTLLNHSFNSIHDV